MNYEERRLKIVMWTVVALLILSIAGASLLFIMKLRTPSTRLNTVNIGSRITGGAFKSNLTNADVWDGTSTTDWTGSGTESDPYLITKASQLAGLSENVKSNINYLGYFFKLTCNIDLNNLSWTSLGRRPYDYEYNTSSRYFCATFDGDGHTIFNISISDLFFGSIKSGAVKNLFIEYTPDETVDKGHKTYKYGFPGVIGDVYSGTIDNVHVTAYGCTIMCTDYGSSANTYHSGFCRVEEIVTLNNCSVRGLTLNAYGTSSTSYSNNTCELYGFVAQAYNYLGNSGLTITKCYNDTTIIATDTYCTTLHVAGFIGGRVGTYNAIVNVSDCFAEPTIICKPSSTVGSANLFGIVNNTSRYTYTNNLVQGSFTGGYVYGSVRNVSLANATYAIVNMNIESTLSTNGSVVFNTEKVTSVSSSNVGSGVSSEQMKLASTYAGWTDFDEHWIIDSKINNGYPMLRAFVDIAQVTGFDGDGTENSPYLIKTHQDMLGVASYYNDNNLTKGDIYWKVANDIDMSVDANDMLIHFTPICYAKEFDGYFDGNGKTISGLLIDNQYEYTGLFGTIASNHYVKDLTIKGNIYWDEAYAVGGVAGRVLAGGYLQNCHFEGNIIGVLNTKSSTETNGVVGKFEIDGAIDSTATYTDLKYAKIGGSSEAPTYTYYLYDWAQIKTYLYDKKVG